MKTTLYLPSQFETLTTCQKQRLEVIKSIHLSNKYTNKPAHIPEICEVDEMCNSGLCSVCCRSVRSKLLRFIHEQEWHQLNWLFTTVFVDGWTKAPGDYSVFENLRTHKDIKNLKQRIHRLKKPNTLVFGSIETLFKTVNNNPTGKPFHLHLMVSGVDEQNLERCIRAALPVDRCAAFPIITKVVKSTSSDFIQSASYAFKLPFWKRSYIDFNDANGKKQFPKPAELAELIANLGAHAVSERLILLGMRFHSGKFKLIPK